MGIVLQFQSLPLSMRRNMSQLHNEIRSAKGKKAEIVIFPGVRHESSFGREDIQALGSSCRAGECPAE